MNFTKQWTPKWFDEGATFGVFISVLEREKRFTFWDLSWFEPTSAGYANKENLFLRAAGCKLVALMPTSGLEETIKELMELFEFHSRRNELLPAVESQANLLFTTTAEYSTRPSAIFAP